MKPEKGKRTDSIAPFPCIAYTRCAFTLFDIYTRMHVRQKKKQETRVKCFVAKANGKRKMRILSLSRSRKTKRKIKVRFLSLSTFRPHSPSRLHFMTFVVRNDQVTTQPAIKYTRHTELSIGTE